MFSVEQKIQHLKDLGFSGDLSEIRKMYSGEWFNTADENYQKLINFSNELCEEFSGLFSKLLDADPLVVKLATERQQKILDMLFPGHGMLFGGRHGLKAVIGLVDFDGMNYINMKEHFNPTALVHVGEYVFLGPEISFADEHFSFQSGNFAKLGRIEIKDNTWICANCKISTGSNVSAKSVIALGSVVTSESQLKDNTLAFGNPCMSHKFIGEDYVSKKEQVKLTRTDNEIKRLLQHVRNLGIEGDLSQYIRQLNCERYNTLEETIGKIFDLSHNLCYVYNDPQTSIYRKKLILDALFPIHGRNLVVGDDLFVDILGTCSMGDNVKLGNSTNIAGNIFIGNNVKGGNNLVLQCIGHSVKYKERQLGVSETGGPIEINVPGFIKINNNLTLSDGTKIVPNVILDRDTNPNELVLH